VDSLAFNSSPGGATDFVNDGNSRRHANLALQQIIRTRHKEAERVPRAKGSRASFGMLQVLAQHHRRFTSPHSPHPARHLKNAAAQALLARRATPARPASPNRSAHPRSGAAGSSALRRTKPLYPLRYVSGDPLGSRRFITVVGRSRQWCCLDFLPLAGVGHELNSPVIGPLTAGRGPTGQLVPSSAPLWCSAYA
jgi:hypothetical protein